MRYVVLALILTFVPAEPIPRTLEELANAERAFAERAQHVSVRQAFIEFFAEDAVGFQSGKPDSAQAELRRQPDRPRDPNVLFWWEPRYGDIAASGDLGWLTGPVRMGKKDDSNVRHGNYSSIWKRQADGSFKVVIDIGIQPPEAVPFPAGFTRAPFESRYSGSEIRPIAEASLLDADRALMRAARESLAAAYAPVLASGSRIHRNGHLPWQGAASALEWLKTQPPLTNGEPMYAETAKSADLGYTWGSYAQAGGGGAAESGYYARVWVRDSAGAWKIALDVTQPKRP